MRYNKMVSTFKGYTHFWIVASAVGLLAGSLYAQTVPPDRKELETGAGAGMAAYADPNGYPGPKHILELQDTLHLTDDQLKDIESIYDEMSEDARWLGERIILKEEELHSLFVSAQAGEDSVKRLAAEIGTLRGELRGVHLIAHVRSATVLDRKQIALYTILRSRGQKK